MEEILSINNDESKDKNPSESSQMAGSGNTPVVDSGESMNSFESILSFGSDNDSSATNSGTSVCTAQESVPESSLFPQETSGVIVEQQIDVQTIGEDSIASLDSVLQPPSDIVDIGVQKEAKPIKSGGFFGFFKKSNKEDVPNEAFCRRAFK